MKKRIHALSVCEELRAPQAKAEGATEGLKAGTMVWYAGAPVYRYDWMSDREYMLAFDMSPKAVDLSRMNGAPLLADHARYTDRHVGVIENARIEGGKGKADYRLADTPDTESIRAKVEQGIIRQVSMEAVVLESEDVTPKGSKMRHFLATKWQPQAVALVPVGADPGARLELGDEAEESDLWIAEGLYQPRLNLAEAGAASQQQTLLALLMQRRQWQ